MANAHYDRHSARTAVTPPSGGEPALREGWGSAGTDRPARLMQHVQTDDTDVTVRPLMAALVAVALVLIAAGVIVVAFAF